MLTPLFVFFAGLVFFYFGIVYFMLKKRKRLRSILEMVGAVLMIIGLVCMALNNWAMFVHFVLGVVCMGVFYRKTATVYCDKTPWCEEEKKAFHDMMKDSPIIWKTETYIKPNARSDGQVKHEEE